MNIKVITALLASSVTACKTTSNESRPASTSTEEKKGSVADEEDLKVAGVFVNVLLDSGITEISENGQAMVDPLKIKAIADAAVPIGISVTQTGQKAADGKVQIQFTDIQNRFAGDITFENIQILKQKHGLGLRSRSPLVNNIIEAHIRADSAVLAAQGIDPRLAADNRFDRASYNTFDRHDRDSRSMRDFDIRFPESELILLDPAKLDQTNLRVKIQGP